MSTSKIKILSKTYTIKPWVTTNIILSIRHRDHLHSQVWKHSENYTLKQFYNKFRNTLTTKLEKQNSPITYYKNELLKAGINNKRCWEIINETSNCNKIKQQTFNIKDHKSCLLNS